MHIISRKKLLDFIKLHPNSSASLCAWYQIVKNTDFSAFVELRGIFPSADQVKTKSGGLLTVFNISGNKFRLVVAIHYNRKMVFIRNIMTHKEYDKESWKKN